VPGTRNAIRTSLSRLWLQPLVHVDPDIAYFETRENHLLPEQRKLLQDLALVCKFKATSGLPQWFTVEEREELRRFLVETPLIEKVGKFRYSIDGRSVDFSPAMSMPSAPKGLEYLWSLFLGWLGNIPLVLLLFKARDDAALRKRRASL